MDVPKQPEAKSMMDIISALPAKTAYWFGVISAIVGLFIIGFVVLVVMMFQGKALSVSTNGTTTTAAAANSNTNKAAANTNAAPAVAVDSSKVKTDGSPIVGNEDAPVTIAYWSDYQCPFCQRNEQQTMPSVIKDYVDAGKAKIVYKDFAFLGADSYTLGEYARAVWETAPDKFEDWHKAIFDAQGQENTGWATTEAIETATKTVFDDATTKQLTALAASKADEYKAAMDADKSEGTSMGVTGTPAFVIGDQLVSGAQPYATVKAAIDAAL